MKKSYILILAGVFIIITSILCINSKDNFIKREYFNSPEELISYIDNKPLIIQSNFSYESSTQLKEVISKRKRIYGSGIEFKSINFEDVFELTKEDKDRILGEYEKHCKNLSGYKIPTKKIPMIINGFAYTNFYTYREDDNHPKPFNMELVFVDEGQGYVIDYIVYSVKGDGEND